MGKFLLALAIAVIVVAGGFLLLSGNTKSEATGNTVQDNVKKFVVDSSHLRFYIDGEENPDIVVNEGDLVRIEFSSSEGFHDWVLDEFNAHTQRVSAGESNFVEFVANKKGAYEYYCSVGQHRAAGMFGKFIVE